ncbi:hypothetical protein BDP27DRAFT_1369508 [Rhodocollybia butyracea]|uniref:Uncharacterized protein n=1 Tax=Rhodocollybia butyracea TaxID=206335 RepID=A0A9P5PAY0_9AGAR|nr:hypothetical protein BDP27DRAFT_1369508 [Rhodocollybia butyracea]
MLQGGYSLPTVIHVCCVFEGVVKRDPIKRSGKQEDHKKTWRRYQCRKYGLPDKLSKSHLETNPDCRHLRNFSSGPNTRLYSLLCLPDPTVLSDRAGQGVRRPMSVQLNTRITVKELFLNKVGYRKEHGMLGGCKTRRCTNWQSDEYKSKGSSVVAVGGKGRATRVDPFQGISLSTRGVERSLQGVFKILRPDMTLFFGHKEFLEDGMSGKGDNVKCSQLLGTCDHGVNSSDMT